MKKLFLAFALAVAVVVVLAVFMSYRNRPSREDIVGTWQMDLARSAGNERGLGMLKESGGVQLVFSDESMEMMPMRFAGTWQLDGTTVVVQPDGRFAKLWVLSGLAEAAPSGGKALPVRMEYDAKSELIGWVPHSAQGRPVKFVFTRV